MASLSASGSKVPDLPHPGAPVRADRPFVGNETVEDNLAEAIEIAAWKAIGSAKRHVAIASEGHTVTLSGELETEQQRQTLETAIFDVAGVQVVVNKVTLCPAYPRASAESPPDNQLASFETVDVVARPIVYATRFCSFDEASLSAAIRDAVAALDRAFATQGLPPSPELIVSYVNHRHGTVTLQVGMPAAQFAGGGEFHISTAPSGTMATATVEAGHHAIDMARTALLLAIQESGQHAAGYYWQRFGQAAFRPWAGHPAAKIFVPITDKAPV